MTNKMQGYTVFYFCKLLYMFRVDPPPIIRSITLYLQHLVIVKPLLLPAAIVKELRLRLNSVQQFTEINNFVMLHLVGHTLEYDE